MLRRLAKTAVAWGLNWTGSDALIGVVNGARRRPFVAGYHRVAEETARGVAEELPGMVIRRATLEKHLDWLGRRYQFVSLNELGARLESGEHFEKPVAAVTFDDGYSDVYHNAFPLLVRKGIPAAVFVVTDLIGTSCLPLYDRLYLLLAAAYARGAQGRAELAALLEGLAHGIPEPAAQNAMSNGAFSVLAMLLDRLPQDDLRQVVVRLEAGNRVRPAYPELRPLTWDMLAKMRDAGITIGSHTRSHPLLTHETPERVREELAGSRTALEVRLGISVRHFAYPDGRWNGSVVAALAAAGYRYGYTVCPHEDAARPLLTISRRMFWDASCLDIFGRFSEAVLSCHAHGIFDLATRCSREHAWIPSFERVAAART